MPNRAIESGEVRLLETIVTVTLRAHVSFGAKLYEMVQCSFFASVIGGVEHEPGCSGKSLESELLMELITSGFVPSPFPLLRRVMLCGLLVV